MPGILPMKVIKVGTSAQSRIAQACDRCRSKKIRCDGITPCCSQCANVGFECKTSDKLSRRAFPRGYTESLEERVRFLEGEVKGLKDLLDEKDEKIDILSRIHSTSPIKRPSLPASPAPSVENESCLVQKKEEFFRVQQPSSLIKDEDLDHYFMGASSGRAFVDALKGKIQESGKPCSNFIAKSLFGTTATSPPATQSQLNTLQPFKAAPPRLVSDQLINIFFQEWAPLFPVLHRPSFLNLYADYTADPESIRDQETIAQIHLVFSIAGLSSESNAEVVADSELQWQAALDAILLRNTLPALQCLVLAQLYCISKGDNTRLMRYTGATVTLAYRLGLHQSQKRFSLGALTRETRKKVFWSLYTLDCFSAALLGLPQLLKEKDIHTEYPSDVDDENVTERGFQPTLPGESTRVSSALALFKLARIMSKILCEVYPSTSSHDLSLPKITALNDELSAWHEGLAPHLRLQFVQDKPSANVVSSRSPLLSLAYYYVRTLTHRPVVGSGLGPNAASSIVALADSSKHIIQIAELLEERHMSFSMCLNKNDLLLSAGFGLLFQGLDLKQDGKLAQDHQRLIRSIIHMMEHDKFSSVLAFKKMASSVIALERPAKSTNIGDSQCTPKRETFTSTQTPQLTPIPTKPYLQAAAPQFSFSPTQALKEEIPNDRRSTAPSLPLNSYSRTPSLTSAQSGQSELTSRQSTTDSLMPQPVILSPPYNEGPNLDFLCFNDDILQNPWYTPDSKPAPISSEWDRLLCYIDSPQPSSNESLLDSTSPDLQPSQMNISPYNDTSPSTACQEWSPIAWNIVDMSTPDPTTTNNAMSFSEGSVTNGEDLNSVGLANDYRGILMPNLDGLEDLDGNYRL